MEPLLAPLRDRACWVLGQLGQSLDGRIATDSGQSRDISGPLDLMRLHALRALADVVIVGAGTVAADDPRLTVRLVSGTNPVRAVLDPSARLAPGYRVFTDGQATTLHLVAEASAAGSQAAGSQVVGPGVERIPVRTDPARTFPPQGVLAVLRDRGLRRVLVEGGGITVSRFLQAGVLDRLHVSVAPLLIGSGRPGITLPRIERLEQALRPPRVQHHRLGDDLLFDLQWTPDDA
ncbi:RibD family protein [Thiohalocapsa marina]|uniref:RibD family protein n=1 Tax=Thiohalocapsa marina TaxID=424902 RepID=A0A5M8FGM0_9GAMM|nr:RibD family protein [Thiohalocapsa marina]